MTETSPVPEDPQPPKRAYARRKILGAAAAGGLAAAGLGLARAFWADTDDVAANRDRDGTTRRPSPSTTNTVGTNQDSTLPAARWSDPQTWGGQLPSEDDVVHVRRPVLLDVDVVVGGIQIEEAGELVFEPARSLRLAARGNIVVAGQLRLAPAGPGTVHHIEFVDVDESRFRGGHTDVPIEDDVGLWIVESGQLDVSGSPKTAWTRLADAANSGDADITVDDATGWQVGDELVVTPTEPVTVDQHWLHHDRRRITGIRRNRITLDQALEHPHPAVTVRSGAVHRAEVLNLTRNVLISGTPTGRSHVIMLMTKRPQHLAHLGLQHMGPRHGDDEEVLGRYAIHFHADGDGSRGTVVEGAAVFDSTGHAFASHLSDGVTFRDCIAHDLVDDAFWWDLSLDGGGRDLVPSNDIVYERCVAHFVRSGANSRFNLTGFLMGAGDGNIARGCVATGVQGESESSAGFHWPSHSRDDNTWTFENNVAHNNRHSGIYFWQNGAPRTIVTDFTAYQCGQGIFAGSYSNLASYRNCTIYACKDDGLVISALPARKGNKTGETITYEGMYVDQTGLTDYAVRITKHIARGGRVTVISNSTFAGGRLAQIGIPDGGDHSQLYDIIDCAFVGNEFWLADDVPSDTALNVQSAAGSYTVQRSDQPGQPRPEWNASVIDA
jgi:hypothetical protein